VVAAVAAGEGHPFQRHQVCQAGVEVEAEGVAVEREYPPLWHQKSQVVEGVGAVGRAGDPTQSPVVLWRVSQGWG